MDKPRKVANGQRWKDSHGEFEIGRDCDIGSLRAFSIDAGQASFIGWADGSKPLPRWCEVAGSCWVLCGEFGDRGRCGHSRSRNAIPEGTWFNVTNLPKEEWAMHAVVNHPPGPAHDVPLLLPETVRAAQKVIEEAMQKAATPRWIVPDVGMPRIVYYRGVPPIEGAGSALCHTCRLGDACPHGKPARPPYISAVDEWDLLPDA